MATLDISGKSLAVSNSEFKNAVNIFLENLVGKRLSKYIHIDLILKKGKDNVLGYCEPQDEGYCTLRYFEIMIDISRSKRDQLQTLAHELIHVKQYARGELKNLGYCEASWEDKIFQVSNNSKSYSELPWEVEAYGREKEIYNLLKK